MTERYACGHFFAMGDHMDIKYAHRVNNFMRNSPAIVDIMNKLAEMIELYAEYSVYGDADSEYKLNHLRMTPVYIFDLFMTHMESYPGIYPTTASQSYQMPDRYSRKSTRGDMNAHWSRREFIKNHGSC